MFKKFSLSDIIILLLSFACVIISEALWFQGEANAAIFMGLWVPSILGFGIYLKLMKISRK